MSIPNSNLRSKRILVAHNVERHGKGGMARLIENMHAALEPYGWQIDYLLRKTYPTSAVAGCAASVSHGICAVMCAMHSCVASRTHRERA